MFAAAPHSARSQRRTPRVLARVLSFAALAAPFGCASAPPAPPKPVPVAHELKMAWMLQLEDQRILKLPEAEPPPPPVVAPVKGQRPVALPPPPDSLPDLTKLATDADARIRRRAAISMGRVGLPGAVPALTTLLSDTDPDVRQSALFALGLIGDRSASTAVAGLLQDPSPLARGRAAEALGLMAADDAAPAIAKMAAEYAASPAVAGMTPDDETWPGPPEAEAFKLGLFALVRLRAYDSLAAAVLRPDGQPVSTWWPVAYALQRIGDPRAIPALRQLTRVKGRYTPAFAARGLGRAKDSGAAEVLLPLLDTAAQPREVVGSTIIAMRDLSLMQAGAKLGTLAADTDADSTLRMEALNTIAAMKAIDQLPIVQDLITDEWPSLRAAAIRAAAAIDPDSFTLILSGLEIDRHWLGRAALADALGAQPAETALPRLMSLLNDEDKRVVPHVLRSLVRQKAPDAETILYAHLKEADYVIRETAAELIGQLKPSAGLAALREAYETGQPDSAYSARAAAVSAMAAYGADGTEGVRAALADKDWAVRVRAAELLTKLDPSGDHRAAIRPVPGAPIAPYTDPQLIAPTTSPHVFIDTERGTIEFELAVLDAPQTSRSFIALARKGFFNGLQVHRVVANFVMQDGDPRGDGEGGPGYTIRDEFNERPYLRGTVGMALSWKDTGGSQFFITHSPQPHLDGQYTAFGHVVNGMDVVDRVRVGDTIRSIRIWDGKWLE